MDPHIPQSFNHRTEKLSTGRVYHFLDQLPEDFDTRRSSTLLCVHGFPDLWYGWRYQIGPWVRQGFRVVVPDMLGYGGTDKPADPSEYSTKKLCADLAALLDLLAIKKAVLIGHDWGSFIVGRFSLWHPDRLVGLIMMSVPYTPPARAYIPLGKVVEQIPNYGYQLYLASKESTSEIETQLHKFLSACFSTPAYNHLVSIGSLRKFLGGSATPNIPSVLTDSEFQYYYTQFSKGMNGPLNYYRTSKLRYDEEHAAQLPRSPSSDLPVLTVLGAKDATIAPALITSARNSIPNMQLILLEETGHWILVEAKDEVTEKVSSWVHGLASKCPARL